MSLDDSMSICFASILDETINKLSVLGRVLPAQIDSKADATKIVNKEVENYVSTHQTTEEKLEAVLKARALEIKEKKLVEELKTQMSLSLRGSEQQMIQSPLTKDNYEKIQRDLNFTKEVLQATQDQLLESNGFSVLEQSIAEEKEKKLKLQYFIVNEENGRDRIKFLQKEIKKVKQEHETEALKCNKIIAHLKDQVQELKAKSAMESKYLKNSVDNSIAQNLKKCFNEENELSQSLDEITKKIDTEERSHHEIENYLKKHQKILEDKVQFWMQKYEDDIRSKNHDLNVLKYSKQSDLDRLHELLQRYTELEKAIVHERIEKEKSRRKLLQDQLEYDGALLIQNWIRGELVTKKLGPFGKKKKKKKRKSKKKKSK